MPDKDFYTYEELAQMLGVPRDSLYNVISVLRRTDPSVKTTPDPTNYRQTLVHKDAIPALRRYFRLDDNSTATA